ncbi:hypothetical protein Acr_09g0007160 [Actinidia rufa]|uniref:Uncharacterized protein n=1 Tax=Actinidia rufa TaxID=165716 RepID=A0A7J0F6G6_9ERIC|nr:hypothetical protein Acr_09g0007160 [Actinidia rufa]
MKLNIDGSFQEKMGRAGRGGLIRKESELNGSKDFAADFRTALPLKLSFEQFKEVLLWLCNKGWKSSMKDDTREPCSETSSLNAGSLAPDEKL